MHVVCVAGARPNFMKIKPVLDALERRGARTTLVHTGQRYDAGMSDVFFDELGIRPPDHSLNVGSGTHAEQTAGVMVAFEPLLDKLRPDVVVVVGDVNSTLACALGAACHRASGEIYSDRGLHKLGARRPHKLANVTKTGDRPDEVGADGPTSSEISDDVSL